mgnify:CR=1 FL=1
MGTSKSTSKSSACGTIELQSCRLKYTYQVREARPAHLRQSLISSPQPPIPRGKAIPCVRNAPREGRAASARQNRTAKLGAAATPKPCVTHHLIYHQLACLHRAASVAAAEPQPLRPASLGHSPSNLSWEHTSCLQRPVPPPKPPLPWDTALPDPYYARPERVRCPE